MRIGLYVILALIILLLLCSPSSSRSSDPKLLELDAKARLILIKAVVDPCPNFLLMETKTYSQTRGDREIHLLLRDPQGNYYDDETLVNVLCHELAHITSGIGDEHGEEFDHWEGVLLEAARELGFSSGQGITENYPCY